MSNVEPEKILENLKQNSSVRRSQSLDTLHKILEAQSHKEHKDFSIVTIGKISEKQGGPSTQTIRNKTGTHYQELISAWAAYSGTTTKKPLSQRQKALLGSNDQGVLENIEDPVLRAIVGSIIADRNKFRDQLNTLKRYNQTVIDIREHKENNALQSEILELNDMEVSALEEAVTDIFFLTKQWKVTKAGQVKSDLDEEIYKHGYVNAIKKVLSYLNNNQKGSSYE